MNTEALVYLLTRLGIEQLQHRGAWINGCCPIHMERNPSWGVHTESPHYFKCFSCGAKGTLLQLLTRRFHLPERDVKTFLGEKTLTIKFFQRDLFWVDLEAPDVKDESELYPYSLTKRVLKYLKGRGITPRTANRLGLVDNTHDDRVMFPWYFKGALVGVTGRTLVDNEAKTLPYYGTKKGRWLYLPSQEITPGPFCLVEGEIDCIKVYETGFDNVGALGFGDFSKQQQRLVIQSEAEPIILAFDDDETGQRLVKEAVKALGDYKRLLQVNYRFFRKVYRGKKLDPGELSLKHLSRLLSSAVISSEDWPEL